MKRNIWSKLLDWKHSSHRKPLVLRGARQVGKTFVLKKFGKSEFESILYVNFEESPSVKRFFDGDLEPNRILRDLSIYFEQDIDPSKTLIFFDEIQECPNALTSLKYFHENTPEYHIVSAGSLLGVKLAKTKGFPVGKVNFLTLYPCNFFEFLDAIGKEKLCEFLKTMQGDLPVPEPIHTQVIELLRHYFVVGGMPEAVKRFAELGDLNAVRTVHQEILDAYLLDYSKHAEPTDIMRITATWNSIPGQLAKENKKFMYVDIRENARSREYESAIQWLDDAGLIHRSYCVSTPKLPIDSYSNRSIFKIFLLDVGLLSTLSQLPVSAILQGDKLFIEFKGALTENFVAQELKANLEGGLYYWSTRAQSEVDFIVAYEGQVIPLEVKSGTSTKQKSLTVYREKFHPRIAARTSLQNLQVDPNFINYPLYLLGRFPKINKDN